MGAPGGHDRGEHAGRIEMWLLAGGWPRQLTVRTLLTGMLITGPRTSPNFTSIPRIRSERSAFDLRYPHINTGGAECPSQPPWLLHRLNKAPQARLPRSAAVSRGKTSRKLRPAHGGPGDALPRPVAEIRRSPRDGRAIA